MKKSLFSICAFTVLSIGTIPFAQAHTSLAVKEATAGSSFIATLTIGHGCETEDGAKYDTYKLVLDLPTDVSVASEGFTPSIRVLDAIWGAASMVKNDDGVITQLVWEKPEGFATREEAPHLYQAEFRVKLPNKPFTSIVFPAATQYCMTGDGSEISKAWEGSTAPTLKLMPSVKSGWNEITAPSDMDMDAISTYFGSALIVWVGDKAYSSNINTDSAITNKLESISEGATIWVKY